MHALCEWKGQEKREGGREWKREREREAGLSVMSRRGREALGEEDVSQHRRELEQWVEEKKKEKRERDQSWKGFFFAVLSRLWTCKMDRYDGEKVWLLALCIWLCACTSACVHELQLCHISQRDGRNTECRQIEALLSLRFVLSSCVCVSPRCCYVTVLILIGFDSFRCWWKYPDHMCIDLCVFWFNAHVIWNQLVVFLRTSVLCLCFTVDMAAACFHCGLVSWLFSRLNE